MTRNRMAVWLFWGMALAVGPSLGVAAPPRAAFNAPFAFPAGYDPFAVAAGDFNGDGIPDLVVGALVQGNTVTVFLGSTDVGYRSARLSLQEISTATVIVTLPPRITIRTMLPLFSGTATEHLIRRGPTK